MRRYLPASLILLLVCWCMPSRAQTAVQTLQNAVSANANGTTLTVRGYGGAIAQISGTFTATVTWEAQLDGTNWVAVLGTNQATGVQATTATSTGIYTIACPGAEFMRARVTWTSGTSITVKARATPATLGRVSGGIIGDTTAQLGALNLLYLSNPGAPTVTPQGTTGSTTWSYKAVAKLKDGTGTAAGAEGTTTTGNATLTGTNFNRLSVTAVPNAYSYDWYRTAAGGTPSSTGKIGNSVGTTFDDTGIAGDASSPPTTNLTATIDVVSDAANASLTLDAKGTGGVLFPNGAAATPSISFTNSPTTGLFRSAADVIGFGTAGVERWVINSSGAFNPTLNNTYDIGNGLVNPRDVSVGRNLILYGATSGSVTHKAAAVAGTNTITWPAGTTDFSATGGASQVVKQVSAGAAFTLGQLAASDLSNGVTGSGGVVLASTPAITGGTHTGLTSLGIRSTGAAFDLTFATDSVFTAGRTITFRPGDAARIVTLSGDATLSGTNTGDQTITLTGGVTGSGTGSFAATVVTNANLTGPITSVGNATSVAAQTGTGTTFVMQTSPSVTGGAHTAITSFGLRDTSAAFDLTIAAVSSPALGAGRTLTLNMQNVAHTIVFGETTNTITFPDAPSGTVPFLNLAQTWTALQSFGTNLGGTLQTAAQPNVTSLGTLTGLTLSGVVNLPAGTAGSPSLVDVNSTTTGIWFSSAGNMNISTAGVERLHIDSGRLTLDDDMNLSWRNQPSAGAPDLFIRRAAAANLALGTTAANPPLAQTISVQNASGTDIAGASFTIDASQGTGTGVGGSFIIRVAGAGTTGSSLNALAAALTIDSTKLATFVGNVVAPTVIGGTATTSDLNLQTTSGVGAAGADMHFLVGNAGGTEAATILNSGVVGIGNAAPIAGFLHIGPGTDTPIQGTRQLYVTGNGTTVVVVRDSTNNVEAGLLAYSGGAQVGASSDHSVEFIQNNIVRATLLTTGNLKLAGTAVRATTEGTNHLDIFDGAAPVGTLTNGISLYSTTGELRVMDAAGNPTLLSPHDKNNNWIFDSYVGQGKDRKRIIVDMEKMVRFLNKHFGADWIHEYAVAN